MHHQEALGVIITVFPGIGYTVYTQFMDPLGLASGAKLFGGERRDDCWRIIWEGVGGMEKGGRAVEGGNGKSVKWRNGGEE